MQTLENVFNPVDIFGVLLVISLIALCKLSCKRLVIPSVKFLSKMHSL